MVFLYKLGIRVYLFLVYIVSPFNKKAKLWLSGRNNWQAKIKGVVDSSQQSIWVHCSSLGEFEQGRPLIESIKAKNPNAKIILTFFSPSGYEIRKNYNGVDHVFYLPIDTSKNAKKFIELINPKFAVFVKYEFWYFYLKALREKNIPTYIISANFRIDQVFFKSYGRWYREFLENFDHLFVQNTRSQELLNSIEINNVTVTGDTRFDRVVKVASDAKTIPFIEQFCATDKVIIAGSTWPKDEEILVDFIRENHDKVKVIIAPHEIDSAHIQNIQKNIPFPTILYTKHQSTDPDSARILIVDTIGLLASIYRYGHVAYIGGGFGVGIHNTLEAATFGIPVVFGPNYQKFQEAKDLISCGAGFSINSSKELSDLLNLFLSDEQMRSIAGDKSKSFVHLNVGATDKILGTIASKHSI